MSGAFHSRDTAPDQVRGIADAAHDAVETASDGAIWAIRWVQERPMQAATGALLTGLLIGLMLRR